MGKKSGFTIKLHRNMPNSKKTECASPSPSEEKGTHLHCQNSGTETVHKGSQDLKREEMT